MTNGEADVLVIGAGVCGLTSALALSQAGLRVTVQAAEPPELTTSAVAGAVWGPVMVESGERVDRWGRQGLDRLRELAAEPAAQVRLRAGIDAYQDALAGLPEWNAGVGERRACDPAALPTGYRAGWRFTAPVVWMPGHLAYLSTALQDAAVTIATGQPYGSLAGAALQCDAPVIVNCTGAGAHDLVPDPALTPVRGQVVVITNPGITEFFIGHGPGPGDVTYLFPHDDTVVLGGTAQAGDWSTEPDPDVAQDILARCAAVDPRVLDAKVLAHRVGLRPARPAVRLEAEALGGGRHVVHNYGHGGAGVTLAWGCALEVAGTVLQLLG
ncbi:MAG: FAD-dependent oxidoreductase [Streptosporangiaceae bacterium]